MTRTEDQAPSEKLSDSKLGLFLINIQSLRHKTDELYLLLEELEFPDIIAITEHWLNFDEPVFVKNYTTVARFDRTNFSHGGTMIMSLNNDFSEVTRYNDLLSEKVFEFSIVHHNAYDLYIICIYRTPDSDVQLFCHNLLSLLESLPLKSKLILCGDLNIDFLSVCAAQEFLQSIFDSFGIAMHVGSPTRISNTSSSTIDYVVSSFDPNSIACNVFSSGLSDHEAVLTEFSIKSKIKNAPRKLCRIFSEKNAQKFSHLCKTTNWDTSSYDVDTEFSIFVKTLTSLAFKSFPLRPIKNKHNKPWTTKGLRISSKNMRSLSHLKKFSDSLFFHNYVKLYRKIYHKTIRAAKDLYYNRRIVNSGNVAKETWSIVNELRNKASSSSNISTSPENLNDYFVNVAKNLTNTICPPHDPLSYLSNDNVNLHSFFFSPVVLEELRSTINTIKNKSSSGTDGLTLKMFSNLPESTLNHLTTLINMSFQNGIFPKCLKTAIIIPLHKGGDKDEASNYRPIALLPTLSKIIERLVKSRLVSFLFKYKILTEYQFGFLSNKSTNDAMFSLLNKVYSSLNNHHSTATIFCDFSKAFDCVNHKILINKLQHYGFRGSSLEWFKSYLSNRSQLVRVDTTLSSSKPIECGVPQGSVLGPILFLLFINDIANINISGKICLFADDTSFTWSNKDITALHRIISNDLITIKSWCDSNLLSLNISKTKALSYKNSLQPFVLNNTTIDVVKSVKFLGLVVDNSLKWDIHIEALSKKLSSACFALRSVSKELNLSVARTVYYALFESHLRYALPFWGTCCAAQFDRIFKLQKRAVRYSLGLNSRTHCRDFFKELKILTLPSLFIFESVCLIRKHVSASQERPSHTYPLRNAEQDLYLPTPRSELVKSSILYNSKKMHNHLPFEIKSITSFFSFRKALNSYLLDKAFYAVNELYLN